MKTNNQVIRKKNFEAKTCKKRCGAEQEAQEIFFEAELNCFKGFTTVFNHGELNDNSGNYNDQEEFVVEEMLKNVVFIILKFSGVDFIEDLKEYENIEEYGVVFTCFIIPVFNSDG